MKQKKKVAKKKKLQTLCITHIFRNDCKNTQSTAKQ